MQNFSTKSVYTFLQLEKSSKILKSWQFWFALSVLILGIVLNNVFSYYIGTKFGKSLPVLNDLLLSNLPYYKIAWFYDIFAIIPLILVTIYIAHKKIEYAPYYILLFGILQLVRAFFILLTPIGSPNGDEEGIFRGAAFMFGMYPSGHTGSSFLAFLVSDGIYRKVLLVFSILVMITLIFGRGHYSIDVFSAIIFSYAVFEFCKRFQKKMCIN
jgi:membrane-associated phospholipid phosphatase